MFFSWLHHFPIVAPVGSTSAAAACARYSSQRSSRSNARALAPLASEPRCQRKATTRPESGGFGWNIGGIIVGKSSEYDQEYSEYIFKRIGLAENITMV